MSLKLASRAFQHEGVIPDRYSKDGGNISPPLAWTDVPQATKSLALIMDDPDAPSGVFAHWLVYNIPPTSTELNEDLPATPSLSNNILQGRNGFGELGYGGPRPPTGTHRYFVHLYALDAKFDLPSGVSREQLDQALQGHILEEAQLMGRYEHREIGSRVA
ncbi:MAG: YbhB/YbcL family Raf kinase inhibitor-like protein [Bryobacteraceae bacterium]